MSYDGNGKPGKGSGATAMSLNGMPFSRRPSSKTDRLQREPARGWHRNAIAMNLCKSIGHEAAPTFFWGGKAARAKAEHR